MAATYSDLEGKVVLVTGGGSGIGEAIVRRFAAQKSKVAFIDIKENGVARAGRRARLGAAARSISNSTDLTDIAALRASIARIQGRARADPDPVNNAAHDERHATETVTPEYWDDRIAVNLKHQFFAAQAVLPDMKAAERRRDRQFRVGVLDGRAGRDGRLYGREIGRHRPNPVAGAGLRFDTTSASTPSRRDGS